MDSGTIVLIVVILLIVFGFFATRSHPKTTKDYTKRQESPKETRPQNFSYQPKTQEKMQTYAPQQIQQQVQVKSDPVKEFREQFRTFVARGNNFETAFSLALKGTNDQLSFEDALEEASKEKCAASDLAVVMLKENNSLREIVTFLNDHTNLEMQEIMSTLVPLATGDSQKAKASNLLDAINSVFNLDDEGEKLIPPLITMGCSQPEIAEILYRETSMNLGNVIVAMKIENSPTVISELAKSLDVDLTDSDEYESLRNDDNISFKTAAKILKACGKDAKEVLDAEHGYGELSLTDNLDDVIASLTEAGFTKEEILDGVWHSDLADDENGGAIVDAFYQAHIPMDEIVAILKKENVDPGDLDEELRDQDVDIKTRVTILHSFLLDSETEKNQTSA